MSGLIVHEWLEPLGGAEKVVDAMLEAFPGSRLVALWNDAPEKYLDVHESWLARTPLRHHKAGSLPLFPSTWRRIVAPTDDVDFVLVSSHLFAHHIAVRTTTGVQVPKFVYAHTPARYIWEPDLDRRGQNLVVRAASFGLKPLDRARAQEATKIAANSEFVRRRIQRAWHRDADVIYPPVDVEKILGVEDWREELTAEEQDQIEELPETFILGASRLVPYKRLDWVIRAAVQLELPVVIAGSGPEEQRLRSLAAELGACAVFLVGPSTPMLYSLYQQAEAFVFPAIEDFGIMPVEAMAAGARVVVSARGGAAESVAAIGLGSVSAGDTVEDLVEAISRTTVLDGDRLGISSMFGRGRFVEQIREWIADEH